MEGRGKGCAAKGERMVRRREREKVEKALGERERETASAFSCLWGS